MPNNVLIFSDGTGQGASMPERETNILRLFRATENAAPGRQLAFYDPGLGASDANVERDYGWWRWSHDLISKATGLGISQNIKDCYAGLIRRYQPGDRIYLFGFSRGAYTVRSLGGVLSLCGVPQRDAQGRSPAVDEAACQALVDEAVDQVYKHYGDDEATKSERQRRGASYRERYGGNLPGSDKPPVPYFVGVFDTVRALGIPGSSDVVLWRHAFHDDSLNERVPYARHVLAIDENRATFEPVLWDEAPNDVATGRMPNGGCPIWPWSGWLMRRRRFRTRLKWIAPCLPWRRTSPPCSTMSGQDGAGCGSREHVRFPKTLRSTRITSRTAS
jgi:uncharacterized protein (DUF2235 family)